jgi:hypothetical protein
MTRRAIVLLLSIALGSLSGALEQPLARGARGGEGAIGRLSLRLVTVRDPTAYVQAWDSPEGGGALPQAIYTFPRGREFGIGVVFADCPPGEDGKCSVVATYSIHTLEGRELVAMRDVPVWLDTPPPAGRWSLGKGLWRTSSEPSDPLGPYLYRATVLDRVSGGSVVLERQVSLVE